LKAEIQAKMTNQQQQQDSSIVASSAPQVQASQQSTHSVSSQLLGQTFNPLQRRFNLHLATINYLAPTVAIADPIINIQGDPLSEQRIKDFIRFLPVVHWRSLSVELIPTQDASITLLSGRVAWIPSVEAYPSSWKEMSAFPTVRNIVMGPRHRSGFVEPLTLEADWTYGNQRQIKPIPLIGGAPKFSMRCRLTPLRVRGEDGNFVNLPIDNNARCYNLYVVGEVLASL
jgi:hypothetical protein